MNSDGLRNPGANAGGRADRSLGLDLPGIGSGPPTENYFSRPARPAAAEAGASAQIILPSFRDAMAGWGSGAGESGGAATFAARQSSLQAPAGSAAPSQNSTDGLQAELGLNQPRAGRSDAGRASRVVAGPPAGAPLNAAMTAAIINLGSDDVQQDRVPGPGAAAARTSTGGLGFGASYVTDPVRPIRPVQRGPDAAGIGPSDETVAVTDFRSLCACLSPPLQSDLSDHQAWDRVQRSLIIAPIPLEQMDRVREAEAMLLWGCAHVLDDRPWRMLPKNLLARMSNALDLPQIWEDAGVLSPFVADAVLDKFIRFSETTDSRYLVEMTQGVSASLTLELIRQSDACQFFQRKTPEGRPTIITGSREPTTISGWSVHPGGLGDPRSLSDQIRELVRESMSVSLRSICEPLHIPPSTTPAGSGGSMSDQRERSVRSELELALAEASGSKKASTSASGPAHRKSRPKRRRSSDSGSDSDGEDPDCRILQACRALRDHYGGISAMTAAIRMTLPVLTIPAFRIGAEMLQTYLSPQRFRATYLWGSKTPTEVTKLLLDRRRSAKLERKGYEVLDGRNPFDNDQNFSWNIDLRYLGNNPDWRAAASSWGDLLLKAFYWSSRETSDMANMDVSIGLARVCWANLDLAISTAGARPSPYDLNYFRTAVINAFQLRLTFMQAELSRLPTVIKAAETQAVQVPLFLDLIAARISESLLGSMAGSFASFLARDERNATAGNETLAWAYVYRPFFSGVLNSAPASGRTEARVGIQPSFTGLSALQHSIATMPYQLAAQTAADTTVQMRSPSSLAFHTVQAALPQAAYAPPPYRPQPTLNGADSGGWVGSRGRAGGFDQGPGMEFGQRGSDRAGTSSSIPDRDRGGRAGQSNYARTPPPMCRPLSPAIVGLKIARLLPPPTPDRYVCGHCLSRLSHVNGPHRADECPLGYFLTYHEACPGFDAEGNVISADWPEDGTNIRRGVKAKWKLYIDKHRIPPSAAEATVGGVDYDKDRVGPMVDLPRAAPGRYFRGRPGRG